MLLTGGNDMKCGLKNMYNMLYYTILYYTKPVSPGCSVSDLLYAGHTLLLHDPKTKTVTTNKTSITAIFFIMKINY